MWNGPSGNAPSGNSNWRGGPELDNGRAPTGPGHNNNNHVSSQNTSGARFAQPTGADWWGALGPADEREENELFTQKITTGMMSRN